MADKAQVVEDSFTEKAVGVFRACARVPIASRAHIRTPTSGGRVEVEVTWTQKDIERGKKLSYDRSYFIEKGSEGLHKLHTSSGQTAVSNM